MGLTLALKSGGSVLAPVRRFTRKAFQLEYLCCMPVGESTKTTAAITTNHPITQAFSYNTVNKSDTRLTFWRYKGFAARSAPSHRVHFRDAEITPEVFTAVVVKAFIPQESFEPCTA